jgi:hypothetical protein
VEEGVEFLDRCPLVLLLDLGVGLGLSTLGAGSPALGVKRLIFCDRCFFSSGSRKTRSAGNVRAGHRLGLEIAMSTWTLRVGTGGTSGLVALAVIQYDIFFVAKFALLQNAVDKFFQVVLCEAVILKELLNFIVDVLGKLGTLISILNLEFVDEKTLELLTLLNVKKSLLASLAHFGASCGCTITLILFGSHR